MKIPKILTYSNHWRTTDTLSIHNKLKVTVSDLFIDHNVGGIGIFVVNGNDELCLKLIIGLKEYTRDPSSVDTLLFRHSYALLEDVEDSCNEIIKFDFNVLNESPEVGVLKLKHYKKKFEEDGNINSTFPSVKEG